MRAYPILVALAALVLLGACTGPSPTTSWRPAQQQFEQRATTAGLAGAFQPFAAANAVFLPDGGQPVSGRDGSVHVLQQGAPLSVQWSSHHVDVGSQGTLASVRGSYVVGMRRVEHRRSRVGYGKFVIVWKKSAMIGKSSLSWPIAAPHRFRSPVAVPSYIVVSAPAIRVSANRQHLARPCHHRLVRG